MKNFEMRQELLKTIGDVIFESSFIQKEKINTSESFLMTTGIYLMRIYALIAKSSSNVIEDFDEGSYEKHEFESIQNGLKEFFGEARFMVEYMEKDMSGKSEFSAVFKSLPSFHIPMTERSRPVANEKSPFDD